MTGKFLIPSFKALLFLIIAFLFYSSIFSQEQVTSPQSTKTEAFYNDPPKESDIAEIAGPNIKNSTLIENGLSFGILIFILLVLFLEFLLIHLKRLESDQGLRIFAITLIIGSSLFLVTAGYTNDQIAPVLSLLGTLAGYLLGNFKNKSD